MRRIVCRTTTCPAGTISPGSSGADDSTRTRKRTFVTLVPSAPGHTAWMPHPCCSSDMNAASMSYLRSRNSDQSLAAVHGDDGPRAEVDPVTLAQRDHLADLELPAVAERAVGRSGVVD